MNKTKFSETMRLESKSLSRLEVITILKKRTPTKKEFSQVLVIVSWAVTIVWISLSFALAFFDKDTNSEVTISLITESFGVTLAYFIYQATLKLSRNKYGVDLDGVPFKLKTKLEEVTPVKSEDSSQGLG